MKMKHELLVTHEAVAHFSKSNKTYVDLLEEMESIADSICTIKGWKVGLNCMVVLRDGRNGRTPYFVINQVLDTQTRVLSTADLNMNTPSLNSDAHCIMSIAGNGPNRYGGFARLLKNTKSGKLRSRIV